MSEQGEALLPVVDELRVLRDRIGAMITAFDRPVCARQGTSSHTSSATVSTSRSSLLVNAAVA